MSLLRLGDYLGANRDNKVYSKKVKIPTSMRTHKIKCSIAKCREHAPFPVVVSASQVWNLCRKHYLTHTGKDDKYEAFFQKASNIMEDEL